MTDSLFVILAVIVSYLIGAVPFGLIATKLISGVDVRTVGSGNIGATNVLRAAGKKAAILTLLADGLKGFLPVYSVLALSSNGTAAAFAGAAAVVGHNFPVYLRFKGGKGIATGFGVILAVSPVIGLVCLVVWLLVAVIWKYSSLAGLTAFACFPILSFFRTSAEHGSTRGLSLFIFALIYIRHRENIKRLIAGTEPKIGRK
jgi:glycerol-3-phosphate acyltransferase PlsY